MNSLFLRIFLWFWLAMVVMAVVLVVTSPYFTQSRSRVDRWEQGAEKWARERVDRTAQRISDGFADQPERREPRGQGRRGSPVFVFDDSGREISGREVPQEATNLAGRIAESGTEEAHRRGGIHVVGKPVFDPEGRRYVVVAFLHRPPRPIDLVEPGALWLRLTALALVVGILSFLLARYLSSPAGALREATRQLGEGDLSARVGGRVARRRDEIGQLARDFDTMAGRLEKLVGSQRRLLRDVSHELRSPLARLRVALELARDRAGTEAVESIDRIALEAERIDELIGQLLFLERLEAGETDGEMLDFDLAEVVVGVVDDASFEASAGGREVESSSDGGCSMRGSPNLVRSAVDNVVRNALRHAPEGSTVTVALERKGDWAVLTVRDTGPGVPDDQIGSLFKPFTRVAEARERSSGGAGLGLAITRRAVEIHGGEVNARNHPEGGLEVTLLLPAAAAS